MDGELPSGMDEAMLMQASDSANASAVLMFMIVVSHITTTACRVTSFC